MSSVSKLLAQIQFWAVIAYRMLRIRTVLLMVAFEAIGYEIVKPTKSLSLKFVLTAIMIGALYVCGTCFNDAADEKIDKVNLPNDLSRPLVTTKVTGKQLKTLGLCSLAVALISIIIINPLYVLLVVFWAALNISYSVPPIKISHRGILASLLLSLNYVAFPFLVGALINSGHLDRFAWFVLIGLYCCFVSRILLKDFRDYEGDKKFNKLNFLVRHGPKLTCNVSAIAWIVGSVVLGFNFYHRFPVILYLILPLTIIVLYELKALSYEKQYDLKIFRVAVLGKAGNALTLAVLASITLEAFSYTPMQDTLFVLVIGIFTVATSINLRRPYIEQRVRASN
jgi:4-hydroxybenzoate polyprenyltransferase